MNKNRYLLYLLICGLLLYYGLPNLPIHVEGTGAIFSLAWLGLLLFAFAGNLSALLFSPRKNVQRKALNEKKARKKTSYQKVRG